MIRKFKSNLGSFIFSFSIYFFNTFLMKIPFYAVRKRLIQMYIGGLGENNFIRMYVTLRNGKNIFIGNNNSINQHVMLDGRGAKLIIGNNVDIGQETNIWTLDHDPNDDHYSTRAKSVIIEDYVWIASRVTVLPGVTIGRGAVVATNAVVTKDVAPMTIVAGIPARVIGFRKSSLQYNPSKSYYFR